MNIKAKIHSNALAFVMRLLIGITSKICDSISCDILYVGKNSTSLITAQFVG